MVRITVVLLITCLLGACGLVRRIDQSLTSSQSSSSTNDYATPLQILRFPRSTPIHDDMTLREPHEGYLVLQGGVPEVQDFIGRIWS